MTGHCRIIRDRGRGAPGERIELEDVPEADAQLAATAKDAGFPWWALGLTGGLALSAFIAAPRRPRQSTPVETPEENAAD